MTFPEDLMKELVALATKHHSQNILHAIPTMTEIEKQGNLNYLRRIDEESDSVDS